MPDPADSGGEGERGPDDRSESERERLNRNLDQLLQELRVALPGVQVPFAFLLTVPFQGGFDQVTAFQEKVYFATLLCTAVPAALLMAPPAYHRMTFRLQQKHHLVFTANRLTIGGLGFLALAMTGAVLMVTDYLFGAAATIVASGAMIILFGTLWYALPLRRRLRSEEP